MTHLSELRAVWQELTAAGARYETQRVPGNECLGYRNAPEALRDIWEAAGADFADRTYLVYEDERWTYREAFRQSERVAAWMQAQGIGKGDRVAVAMRNYPEWMIIYWASMLAGATLCGFNAWWAPAEIAAMDALARPRIIFLDAERLARAPRRTTGEAPIMVGIRLPHAAADVTAWRDVIDYSGAYRKPPLNGDDDASIFFTSGTAGTPKAAVLTQRGCVTNIFNILFAAEAQGLAAARAVGAAVTPAAAPIALVTTPLFHVTANNCCAQVAAMLGGTIILMYKWDAGAALDLVERERVTMISGTPVMHRELVLHPRFRTADLSSLQSLGGGGASLPPDILARIERSPLTARASSGYGMTEASGAIASISGDLFAAKPTSCGPVLPAFESRVVDEEGVDAPPGERGELWVRGASVIAGYLDVTGTRIDPFPGGWLQTGDIVTVDADGFVHIVDRKKDMILRGGENIACVEVEAALYEMDGVAECAVFAVPDIRLGEAVGAVIFLRRGAAATAEAVAAHCAARLAAYKIPSHVRFVDAPLPRNASGKILKRDLAATLLGSAG